MAKPTIVTRAGKGSALTWTEGDANLTNLRDATISVSDGTTTAILNLNDVLTLTAGTNMSLSVNATTDTITINTSATTNTGTVTSVGGTGTVNGLTLTGTVTTSGSLTLGGTLDLTSPPAIGGTTASTVRGTTITATSSFSGPGTNLSGTASSLTAGTATTATNIIINTTDGNTSDTTTYPVLVGNASTGNQLPHISSANLSFNASSGILTATTFQGSVVATSVSTSSQLSANSTTANNAKLIIGNNALSSTAWTITGIGLRAQACTYTDTNSVAGTIAASHVHAIAASTLASTNAITVTDAASLFIAAGPSNGTNTTITNRWAMLTGGDVKIGGALTVTGTTTLATALSGLLKTTSGVVSAATAGTDYLAPGGALGTPSSGTVTNLTGTASININGTVGATTPTTGSFTTTTVTGANDLRLNNTANTFYVGFKAPALSANRIWTLPTADGTANQVLKTDGAGVLGWATAGGASTTFGQYSFIFPIDGSGFTTTTANVVANWSQITAVSGVSVSTTTNMTFTTGTYILRLMPNLSFFTTANGVQLQYGLWNDTDTVWISSGRNASPGQELSQQAIPGNNSHMVYPTTGLLTVASGTKTVTLRGRWASTPGTITTVGFGLAQLEVIKIA